MDEADFTVETDCNDEHEGDLDFNSDDDTDADYDDDFDDDFDEDFNVGDDFGNELQGRLRGRRPQLSKTGTTSWTKPRPGE